MSEPTKEVKWSCGCHAVDGVLVAKCTQVAPQGEISAAQHASSKPFARKCARKAAEVESLRGTSPEVPPPGPVVGEGQVVDAVQEDDARLVDARVEASEPTE